MIVLQDICSQNVHSLFTHAFVVVLLVLGLTASLFGNKINAQSSGDLKQKYLDAIEEKISQSDILDTENYKVEFVENLNRGDVQALRMDSIDEIIEYLENEEQENTYNEVVTITDVSKENRDPRTVSVLSIGSYITKQIKYERSLTSKYTLSATVKMNSSGNHLIKSISNPELTLTGFTVGIDIGNISYETAIYDGGRSAYVSAEYTHSTQIVTPLGYVEFHRERCKMYMYYKYDSVYDKGFEYI